MKEFEKHQIFFDKILYCPYLKNSAIEKFSKKSQLRKPAPGMVLKAMEEIPINLTKSTMIGDKKSDQIAARKSNINFLYLNKNLSKTLKKII